MSSELATDATSDGETVEMDAPSGPSAPIGGILGGGPANDPLFAEDDLLMPLDGLDDEDEDSDEVLSSLAPDFWNQLRAASEPHPEDGEPGASTLTADMAQVQPDLVADDEDERGPMPLAFWISALSSDPGKGDAFPELQRVLGEVSVDEAALASARRGARSLARVASRLNARMVHLHRDENSLRAMALGMYFQAKHALGGADHRVDPTGLRTLMESRPVARAVLDALQGNSAPWAETSRSQLEQALVLLNAALPSEKVANAPTPLAPVAEPEPVYLSSSGSNEKYAALALLVVAAIAGAYWLPILLATAPEPPPDSALKAVIIEIRSVQLEGVTLILTVKDSWAERDAWTRSEELDRLLEVTGSYSYEEAHLQTPSGRLLARVTADSDIYWGEGVAPPS